MHEKFPIQIHLLNFSIINCPIPSLSKSISQKNYIYWNKNIIDQSTETLILRFPIIGSTEISSCGKSVSENAENKGFSILKKSSKTDIKSDLGAIFQGYFKVK